MILIFLLASAIEILRLIWISASLSLFKTWSQQPKYIPLQYPGVPIISVPFLPHGFTATHHDLRHAHTTILLQQGVHLKIVQERLGHSFVAITLDIYSHILPGLQGVSPEFHPIKVI